MKPRERRRATYDTDKKEEKVGEPKPETSKPSEKSSDEPSKQPSITKKNSIVPAKLMVNKIAVPPKKQTTVDSDNTYQSEDSHPPSKKNTITEKGFEMRDQAKIKKGNEEGRRSFHFKMNIYNLISSFLGLFGLGLQMIEVKEHH